VTPRVKMRSSRTGGPMGPWTAEEVIPTVAEKKISPKAPAGSGASKSGTQAATRVNKVNRVTKVAKVNKVNRVNRKKH
jgi:hypothetical protein